MDERIYQFFLISWTLLNPKFRAAITLLSIGTFTSWSSTPSRRLAKIKQRRNGAVLALTALLSLLITVVTAPNVSAMGHPIQGSVCTKVSVKVVKDSVVHICTRVNGKLVWVLADNQNHSPVISTKSLHIQTVIIYTIGSHSKYSWNDITIANAVDTVNFATEWWSKVTNDRFKFNVPIVTKPAVVSHPTSCNPTQAVTEAKKALKFKAPSGEYRFIVFAMDAKCGQGERGIAELPGKNILLIPFEDMGNFFSDTHEEFNATDLASVLTHEIGHTFGLNHSTSYNCKLKESTNILTVNTSCDVEPYGDPEDFMGQAEIYTCLSPDGLLNADNISVAQRAIGLGTVQSIPITELGTFTLQDFGPGVTNTLFTINTDLGVAYLEFRSAFSNDCFRALSWSDSPALPSIEIRMVGNDAAWPLKPGWTNSLGIALLKRTGTKLNSLPNDPHFVAGDLVVIPGSRILLTVETTTASSATFTLSRS